MAFFTRFARISENIFLLKNGVSNHKSNAFVEFASLSKKESVPLPPKRPLTAYMIFCKENRNELLKENPALSSPEQIKKLAGMWSQLSLDMKKPYEITARQGTQMYGEAHKQFYENLTDDQKEMLSRLKAEKRESRRVLKFKRALRESGLPKPAATAYSLFIQSQAKGRGDIKHASEFIKEVAEKWKGLSDAAKKPLEEQAQKEKLRYQSEMEQWKNQLVKDGNTALLKEFSEQRGKGKFLSAENLASHLVKEKKGNITDKASSKTKVSKN